MINSKGRESIITIMEMFMLGCGKMDTSMALELIHLQMELSLKGISIKQFAMDN